MLKAEYSRKINKSSFILKPEKECGNEKDSIEMFRYNKIPYFLSMKEQMADARLQFCYDITGKRSLEQLLEYKTLDYLLLQKIITSFDCACIETENYMLTENDILLEPEFVFLESSTEQMVYCYLPGNQQDICAQFKKFMEYLLPVLDHKDERGVRLAYGIYQKVVEEKASLHSVLGSTEKILAENPCVNMHIMEKKPSNKNSSMLSENLSDASKSMPEAESLYAEQNIRDVKQLHAKQNIEVNMQLCMNPNAKEPGFNYRKQRYTETEEYREALCAEMNLKHEQQNGMENRQYMEASYAGENLPYAKKDEREGGRQLKEKLWIKENFQYGTQNQEEDGRYWEDRPKEDMSEPQQISKKKIKRSKQDKNIKKSLQTDSQIQKKEKLRSRAAEKLKKMLLRNIYTDRARYAEEETVFEADTEEELEIRNPTVCLIPDSDSIQNRFVYQGPDRGRDFQCMSQKTILGSDRDESDIYIPIPMVSRVHARIEIDRQGTFLEDMNSTNGTHVNGELLQYRERRMLQKGDIISLAGESYSFH